MIWTFFIVVGLGLVAVIAALVTSRLPYDPMSSAVTTANDPGLPAVPRTRDVDGVRFDFAVRGYRMDQVDEVLDALRDRLAEQDEVIAALRRGGATTPGAAEPAPAAPAAEREGGPQHDDLAGPALEALRDTAPRGSLEIVDADAEGR